LSSYHQSTDESDEDEDEILANHVPVSTKGAAKRARMVSAMAAKRQRIVFFDTPAEETEMPAAPVLKWKPSRGKTPKAITLMQEGQTIEQKDASFNKPTEETDTPGALVFNEPTGVYAAKKAAKRRKIAEDYEDDEDNKYEGADE
jgi:hypothetical protein